MVMQECSVVMRALPAGGFAGYIMEFPQCAAVGATQEKTVDGVRESFIEWIGEARRLGLLPPPS